MVIGFTQNRCVVVATKTSAQHFGMIHSWQGSPCKYGMTVSAGIGAIDMALNFSRCNATVVAGNTFHCDLAMIHSDDRLPGECGMAIFTQLSRGHMGCRLRQGGTPSYMTGGAVVGNAGMVKSYSNGSI